MMRSLWSAASGMHAQQMNIDVISNNLANVNTSGFKKSRAEFEDLMYQTMRVAGSASCGPANSCRHSGRLGVRTVPCINFSRKEICRIRITLWTSPSRVTDFSRFKWARS